MSPATSRALVMGGFDVLHPLARAGVRCAVFARPEDPVHASRRAGASIPWHDPGREPRAAVDALLAFARGEPEPPVLYPPTDPAVLLASRHRDELGTSLRLPLAEAQLVEDLMDKDRFAHLARRLGLPVPASRALDPAVEAPELDLRYPVILKPRSRGTPWQASHVYAKALQVEDAAELRRAWPVLAGLGAEVLAQEAIPGPERRIESYHVYIDATGAVAGEFTGRKIRTLPQRFGESSAIEITAMADVRAAGRDAVERLGLHGVAKLDFKRAPDERLFLLEVNPRFNLWHFPGALAGVNLPALVHADLTSAPRPRVGPVRAGVRWTEVAMDLHAARAEGIPVRRWLGHVARSDAVSGLRWSDPMPFVRGTLWPPVARRVLRRPR